MIMYAKKLHRQEHSKTWDESMRNLDVRGGNIVRAWDDFDEHYEKMINNKESYEVTSSVRELHQYKLGLEDGYNKAKETLYTEEQIREAMDDACIKGFNNNLGVRFNHLYRKDYIDRYIQSLKQ